MRPWRRLKRLIENLALNTILTAAGGRIIIGIVGKESFLGKFYQRKKSVFYKTAHFFSVKELSNLLKKTGYSRLSYYQTLFTIPDEMDSIQKAKKGFGKGGFVVITGEKK